MAKKWLFWFCEGSVCVSGQNQMCRLCGCLKLFLKNAGRQKKIKKHWGGLSVGLLAVPFQYGLYVFGHLSKWFVFVLMFKFWSVYRLWNGRPTIGYNICIVVTKYKGSHLIISSFLWRFLKCSWRQAKLAHFKCSYSGSPRDSGYGPVSPGLHADNARLS